MKNFPRTAPLAILFLTAFALLILPSCKTSSTAKTGKVNAGTQKSAGSQEVPPEMLEAELMTVDGKKFKLSDYKGKVVLINLWATWCGYCKQEMPDLVEFSQHYKAQGLEVIGLNADNESLPKVEGFIKEYEVPYLISWTNEDVYSVLQPKGLPASYLITRDGKFHWAINGLAPRERLKLKIEEALNAQS